MRRLAFALCLALPLAAGDALAGRAPTAEEAPRIEAALRALGYESWKEIEIETNEIEVEDARHSDGGVYDLKLDPQTLEVRSRQRD